MKILLRQFSLILNGFNHVLVNPLFGELISQTTDATIEKH